MSDRDLLEAAARAAGLKLNQYPDENFVRADHSGLGQHWNPKWNPLESDGDAFRLAVKLGISVHQWRDGVSSTHVPAHRECAEPWGSDPYAATRRAIVRAAAALTQPEGGA